MDESKKNSDSAQNIDGVLEELKKSYSSDNVEENDIMNEESSLNDFSHDELQEKLRSQFLNDSARSTDSSSEDNYVIDEDFLSDAYEEDDVENGEDFPKEVKENEYEFYEGFRKGSSQVAKETEEKMETLQETSDNEGLEEIQEGQFEETEKDDKEDQEVSIYQGLEEIQEEADYQTLEEIYASEKVQKIQEEFDESFQISDNRDLELGSSSIAVAVEEEEISSQQRAEENYVDVFYRSNDEGPFGNRSFKEIIAETTMSVDSLEAALYSDDKVLDYEPESFEETEGIPLVIEEDNPVEANAIDNADLALLHQFGYRDDLLVTVSNESIEKLSTEEFANNVDKKINSEIRNEQKDLKTQVKDDPKKNDTSEARKIKTKEKINNQYLEYRKMRGASLLKLLISSVFALMLVFYELLPIFGVEFPSFIDRETSMPLYIFFGALIMLVMLIPATKQIFESFKAFLVNGIDSYIILGITVCLTVLYDFIMIFAVPEYTAVPTFHLCVAIVLILAEVSELLHDVTQMRNFEYYFSEYIFGEEYEDDVSKFKYTLQKSEGKSSIAEKMYAGGVSSKKVICVPQNVDSTNGFFDANSQKSKKSRMTFILIIISAVIAFVLTIVSAIISEAFWISEIAFMATFSFTLPLIAIIAEILPFERLSSNNYSYGSAFASEASMEKVADCDMFVFYDSHLFENCDSKSVNLAIYDSTSKAVLLSCLNSVYSEIGGPLQSALSSIKTQSLGDCKISRVARNGVEATVGTSFSVLIGDEQFMSRYGIMFPPAALGREADKIFTLCISINSRATARIAVKYKLNDVFFDLIQKLSEDKVTCVVETYDPMISTKLVSRLRTQNGFQINIVHKNAADLALEKHRGTKDGALFSALGKDLPILARGSRLNLAVAVSNAKKMKLLRLLLNLVVGGAALIGAIISLALVSFDKLGALSNLELFVVLYWILTGVAFAGIMLWKFPRKNRFVFNKK